MNRIARIITRPSAEGSDKPDIALVVFSRNNEEIKAGRVYEIREVLGELTIVDIGENVLSGETLEDRYGELCWGSDVSTILQNGKGVFMTREEHEERYKLLEGR